MRHRCRIILGIVAIIGLTIPAFSTTNAAAASPEREFSATEAASYTASQDIDMTSVPSGCTLSTIDIGRTSVADCKPGYWRHVTECGSSVTYEDPFSSYHERTCPSGSVTSHSIQEMARYYAPAEAEANPAAACSVRTIDVGRSSEAACSDWVSHRHIVECQNGEARIWYRENFVGNNTITCPDPYKVASHRVE